MHQQYSPLCSEPRFREDSKDPVLTSNDLGQLLSKTPKFLPTPKCLKPKDIANDCDVFGYRLIKTFSQFVCLDYTTSSN